MSEARPAKGAAQEKLTLTDKDLTAIEKSVKTLDKELAQQLALVDSLKAQRADVDTALKTQERTIHQSAMTATHTKFSWKKQSMPSSRRLDAVWISEIRIWPNITTGLPFSLLSAPHILLFA